MNFPLLKCSEEDCLAYFVLRKDARLNNPGACSLEFLSVMQILTEQMLKWIPTLQLQQEKEYLVQCGHLPALMKNKT
jgi:hypothetical protein